MPVSEILSGSEQLQKGRSIPIINTKERPCPSDMITGWMQICQYFILLVFPLFFQERFSSAPLRRQPPVPPPIVHMSGDRCVIRADAIRQDHTAVSPDQVNNGDETVGCPSTT